MIDKRVGMRIKQQREKLSLTQQEFAEKVGLSVNYISTLERGASFPRYEKLVLILNALETSADSIFCDVVNRSSSYEATKISEKLDRLPAWKKMKILEIVDSLTELIENE